MDDAGYVQGLIEARNKIQPWFQKICDSPDVESGFRILLNHVKRTSEIELTDFQFNIGDDPDKQVEEILEAAEEEASAHIGMVKFSMQIPGLGRALRAVFTLKSKPAKIDDDLSDDELEDYEDETPTARGIAAQSMKHSEVMLKEMLKDKKSNMGMLQDQLRQKDQEIASLKRHHGEMLRLYEDLQSLEQIRKLEYEKFKRDEQRKEQVLAMGIGLAPTVLNRLLGSGSGAAAAEAVGKVERSPIEMMVEQLMASLSTGPERMQNIMGNLEPQEMLMMVEIQNYFAQKKAAEAVMQGNMAEQEQQHPPAVVEGTFDPPQPPPPKAAHPFANHPFAGR